MIVLHYEPIGDRCPGGRDLAYDAYVRDYRKLDAISRTRALTLPESLRLEECIKQLDRRADWRAKKRRQRRIGA